EVLSGSWRLPRVRLPVEHLQSELSIGAGRAVCQRLRGQLWSNARARTARYSDGQLRMRRRNYEFLIETNLDRILGTLRAAAPNAEIITFTSYNVDPQSLELTKAFKAVVEGTARSHRVRVADVFAAFNVPPQPDTICNLTLICTQQDSHPSDAGYHVIAE